jgi:chromosomal replication initiation ATPase DnaA
MPRAHFESWVRDMQLLSTQDQQFTFGVQNNYARDWLEERLKATLSRLLSGSLNQSIQVQFIVQEPVI